MPAPKWWRKLFTPAVLALHDTRILEALRMGTEIRLKRTLPVAQYAEMIGTHPDTYVLWENGEADPPRWAVQSALYVYALAHAGLDAMVILSARKVSLASHPDPLGAKFLQNQRD